MDKLTPKEKLFLQEYCKDFNGTRAYKTIYKSVKNDNVAGVNAFKLLRKPKIKAALEKIENEKAKRNEVTQDMIISELKSIAFSDASNYMKIVKKQVFSEAENKMIDFYEAKPRMLEEIPDEQKRAISLIENTKYGVKISTYDKVKALELLGKHIGMFRDKVDVAADGEGINIKIKYE